MEYRTLKLSHEDIELIEKGLGSYDVSLSREVLNSHDGEIEDRIIMLKQHIKCANLLLDIQNSGKDV